MSKKADQMTAIDTLRESLPEGSTLFVIERGRTKSGMSADLSIIMIHTSADEEPSNTVYSYNAAKALGWRYVDGSGHDAVRVTGYGMDRAAHLIETLSYKLHGKPDAFKFRSL